MYLFVWLCLAASLFAQDKTDSTAWKGPGEPLYVVTRNHYAEGFTSAGSTARLNDTLMIQIFEGQEQEVAAQPMTPHRLFMGGEFVGTITAGNLVGLQCDSTALIANPSVQIPDGKFALATDIAGIRTHPNRQHVPTTTQRSLISALASSEFRKNGVAENDLNQISVDRLILTAIDSTNQQFAIGSFSVKAGDALHRVLLVAKLTPKPVVEFAEHHKQSDFEDGKDARDLQFADQLDLDRDGIDEIVVEVTGYENEEFWVYKRQNGSWSRVWVGGQGGC